MAREVSGEELTTIHTDMHKLQSPHTHRYTQSVYLRSLWGGDYHTHTGIHMSKSVYLSSPWCFRWGADQKELTTIHRHARVKGCLPQQPMTLQMIGDHHIHTGIHMLKSVYLSSLWSFQQGVDHHTHRLQSVYLSGLWGFRWGVDHHTLRYTHVTKCLHPGFRWGVDHHTHR